jgi:diguanylate cyclase (GGDEF)-like protein
MRRRPVGAADRPPRLVVRFAVLMALGTGIAAAAILMVVRHSDTQSAERAAIRQARLLADAVLTDRLTDRDVRAPVTGSRRRELDGLLERGVLRDGIVRVTILAASGRVTYSTDHRLIGSRASSALLDEASAGTIVTAVSMDGPVDVPEVLESSVPLRLAGGRVRAVAKIEQDYGPIEQAAQQAVLPVAAVLEAMLVGLFLVFVPALVGVTRRIRRQVAEIEHGATHDRLTDLPNRSAFSEDLTRALLERHGDRVGVLHLDVDRFSKVNDTLGHVRGDELLQQLACRLASLLPDGAVLARFGGDEFGVLLCGLDREESLAQAERLRSAADEPFLLSGVPVVIVLSVGVALAPEHGESADVLLQRADIALSLARRQRCGCALYEQSRDTSDTQRLILMSQLRDGIEREELELFYMPRADTRTGRVVAVEGLVRWRHPRHGLLQPSAFVDDAEHTGLIRPLGRFVLGAALRQQAAWRGQGLDLEVGVNLTMVDLLDLSLPDEVAAALGHHGVEASRLVVEITESSLMADPARVHAVVTRLAALGVRIAIDDFGTGYSSLSYLRRLPVDEIKIDRSFVASMTERDEDASIVRSTIDLAHSLGVAAVAEGVETRAQLEALRALGCDYVQGFLLGRPMPAAELEALLGSLAAA